MTIITVKMPIKTVVNPKGSFSKRNDIVILSVIVGDRVTASNYWLIVLMLILFKVRVIAGVQVLQD